ncbi:MAG: DegV family protein [Chloroflexi bacterium]|nr:DegV family protein [Chloroflexota bacterium]
MTISGLSSLIFHDMIKIVTDSTSDVPPDIAAQLGISIVPVIVQIDGVSYLDGVTLSRQQFYSNLDSYREIPKTAAPSPETFVKVFREARNQGADEIIAIHVNRKFSALCNVAEVAAQEVATEGLRVHVVDSKTVTMGLGWLAIIAARLVQTSQSAQDIVHTIESMRKQVYVYPLIDTLKYLRKSGRASALMASIGDMLQIKILLSVYDGLISQVDRIRTRSRGIARMLEVAHGHHNVQYISVMHTSNDMQADMTHLQTHLSDLIPVEQQMAVQVTPVLGTHVGPMAVGIAMVADV